MFKSGCALGGHKSKVHVVYKSRSYKKKDYNIIKNEEDQKRNAFFKKIGKIKKNKTKWFIMRLFKNEICSNVW